MIARAIARPLLASTFVAGGLRTLRNPGPPADAAEPVIDLIAEAAQPLAQRAAGRTAETVSRATRSVESVATAAAGTADDLAARAVMTADPVAAPVSAANDVAAAAAESVAHASSAVRANVRGVAAGEPLPFATETYVRLNAAVQVAAGLLLATGRAPRLASGALAATLVPTTIGGHRFWELEAGSDRREAQFDFMKNVGLLGGLILAAVDTGGQPGLAWRARHLGHDSAVAASAARANAALATHAAAANTRAARRLARANVAAASQAGALGVEKAGASAARGARRAASLARRDAKVAASIAARDAKVARRLARQGWDATQARADVVVPKVQAQAVEWGRQAQDLSSRVADRLPATA